MAIFILISGFAEFQQGTSELPFARKSVCCATNTAKFIPYTFFSKSGCRALRAQNIVRSHAHENDVKPAIKLVSSLNMSTYFYLKNQRF